MSIKSTYRREFLSASVKIGALSAAAIPLKACVAANPVSGSLQSRRIYAPGTAQNLKNIRIPAGINMFRTTGYADASDGGDWEYQRINRRPEHGFILRDSSGAWFEGMVRDNAIMPGPFGALGQSQNEGVALQNAMQAAIAMGCWLKLDSKRTYVVNPAVQGKNGWHAVADTGQSILLDFNGATVKMAGKLPTRGNSFFHAFSVQMRKVRGKRGQQIPLVHIRNARVDGNMRDQLPPDSAYAYEQRALLRIAASDGNRIDRVLIEDAVIINRIADGILVGPSTNEAFDDDGDGRAETAAIKRCDIIRPYCEVAPGAKRSFISLGSGCSQYNIEQPRCAIRGRNNDYNAIETEFSRIGQQRVSINISGGTVDALEFGTPRNIPDHSRVNIVANNLTIRDYYIQVGGTIRTRNCILPITKRNVHAVLRGDHDGTIFRHGLDETGDVRSLTLRTDYTPSTIWRETNGCRHELLQAPKNKSAKRAALKISPTVKSKADKYVVELNGTYFDPKLPHAIDNYGGGTIITRNNKLAGTVAGVRTGSFAKYGGIYKSYGDDWRYVRSSVSVDVIGNANWANRHVISGGTRNGQRVRLKGKFARSSIQKLDQPLVNKTRPQK